MRVSYNWLKNYLDLSGTTPHELADNITLTGIEVETVLEPGKTVGKLFVGEVLSCESLEDSNHLKRTTVDIGEDENPQIVCGAPNVQKGQKVIVATPGTVLPGDFTIKKSTILGVESNGMICSLDELGFSDSVIPKYAEDGIFVLGEEAIIGDDARQHLGLDDAIIDLEITPNRADAMSMRGVAHEVGALLSQKPAFSFGKLTEDKSDRIQSPMSVRVEDGKDTPIYKMRLVRDVTVEKSPLWLQRKLMNAGIRPIDSIVDVTNYIMLEYGQPLHAFDYGKLHSNEIYVRRANDGEKLVTLDEKERTLSSKNLVITNGDKPIALAGVMGGRNSHVSRKTETIAIESAVFDASLTRRTAQELNLRSESSSRFEKGINIATVQEALDHAASLMAELGGGKVLSETVESVNVVPKDVEVSITVEKLNATIGTTLKKDEILTIFDRLGFDYVIEGDQIVVSIPPRRWDIEIEADLVEEVARMYGYNNIPSTLPTTESIPGELDEKQRLTRHLRQHLEGSGLSEAISYALTTPDQAKYYRLEEAPLITLEYPMSEDHRSLRQNIISGLLNNAGYNVSHQIKDVALYEVGHVFYGQNESVVPIEKDHVAGLITGSLYEKTWLNRDFPVDFYSIKGIAEELLESIGIASTISYVADSSLEELHPGRAAVIKLGEETIGLLGQVHPTIAENYDLAETYVFELNIDSLVEAKKNHLVYNKIPRYPGTSRDIALIVDEGITHEQVTRLIEDNGGRWLRDIRLFDLYQGENIKPGRKSIAYSLSYLNPEATLKEDEVNQNFENVKQVLKQTLDAEVR